MSFQESLRTALSTFQITLIFSSNPGIWRGAVFPSYILPAFSKNPAPLLFFCSSEGSLLTQNELDPRPLLCKARTKLITRVSANKTICLDIALSRWPHQIKTFGHWAPESKYYLVKTGRNKRERYCQKVIPSLQITYHSSIIMTPDGLYFVLQ